MRPKRRRLASPERRDSPSIGSYEAEGNTQIATEPLVHVVRGSRHVPSIEAPFMLMTDNWNDFGHYVTYTLYARRNDAAELVGHVRILNKGGGSLSAGDTFDQFEADWCSFGGSLDYYSRLSDLPNGDGPRLLQALNDLAMSGIDRNAFRDEPAYLEALFRGRDDPEQAMREARLVFEGRYGALVDRDAKVDYKPSDGSKKLRIRFDAATGRLSTRASQTPLPSRIVVLIGRNGSGKSTLLMRLARLAHASTDERREKLGEFGRLEPRDIGFGRIITVSYSAFDGFVVPGSDAQDRRAFANEIRAGTGRYVFCGLRDIAAETLEELGTEAEPERVGNTRLKPLASLTDEFVAAISDLGDVWPLAEAFRIVGEEASFDNLPDLDDMRTDAALATATFSSMSTGHKIVLHSLACLARYLRPMSLAMIDEPETHLHPPLVAAYMQALRHLLRKAKAVAVVATHSPMVAQETMARDVYHVSRIDASFALRRPKRETFGEDTGLLTYDAFGLKPSSHDFHDVLDELVERLGDFDEIDRLFRPGLSDQARAYVLMRLARREQE